MAACATTSKAGGVHAPHGLAAVRVGDTTSNSAWLSRRLQPPSRPLCTLADVAACTIASLSVSAIRVRPLEAASYRDARRSASDRNSDSRRPDSPRRTASARFASSSLARPANGVVSAIFAKRASTLLGLGLASGGLYRHSSTNAAR